VRTTRDENGTVAIFGDQVPSRADFRIPVISPPRLTADGGGRATGGHLLVRELGLNTTRTPVLGVLGANGRAGSRSH